MKLHLQGLKLCPREARFELRGAHLALAEARVVADRVARAQHRAVDEQVYVELAHQPTVEHLKEGARRGVERAQKHVRDSEDGAVDDVDERASDGVRREAARELRAFEREAAAEPEHDGRQQRPRNPAEHLPREDLSERDARPLRTYADVKLAAVYRAEESPEANDEEPAQAAARRGGALHLRAAVCTRQRLRGCFTLHT